jgi:hypothetical protein
MNLLMIELFTHLIIKNDRGASQLVIIGLLIGLVFFILFIDLKLFYKV